MARRSNKTAHVLNLLAGHDAQNDSQNDSQNDLQTSAEGADNTDASAAAKPKTAAPSAPAEKEPERPAPVVQAAPQNISVIDKTEDDPVADLIQQKLMDEFEQSQQGSPAQEAAAGTDAEPPADTTAKAVTEESTGNTAGTSDSTILEAVPDEDSGLAIDDASDKNSDSSVEAVSDENSDAIVEAVSDENSDATVEAVSDKNSDAIVEAESEVASGPITDTAPEVAADTTAKTAADTVTETEAAHSQDMASPAPEISSPEPEPEPEPEFAYLNVMERIVEDKIIYFMRQFDVCTCARCKADTIALTMNGLMPKYIVTTPAAVDPLLSYYTNRLISDVTVEATKACMVVKDNPRH